MTERRRPAVTVAALIRGTLAGTRRRLTADDRAILAAYGWPDAGQLREHLPYLDRMGRLPVLLEVPRRRARP